MTTSRWKRSRAVRLAVVGLVPPPRACICVAAPRISASAAPQSGGTLIVAGGHDVLYFDPAAAYSAADYQLNGMTLRGLFDYKAEAGWRRGPRRCPDLAVEIPTQENGGISADGLTYTIELRDGRDVERRRTAVRWSPATSCAASSGCATRSRVVTP